MLEAAVVIVAVVGGLWAVAVVWLGGESLQGMDQPTGERLSNGDAPKAALSWSAARKPTGL